jgi:hypothetical protein
VPKRDRFAHFLGAGLPILHTHLAGFSADPDMSHFTGTPFLQMDEPAQAMLGITWFASHE